MLTETRSLFQRLLHPLQRFEQYRARAAEIETHKAVTARAERYAIAESHAGLLQKEFGEDLSDANTWCTKQPGHRQFRESREPVLNFTRQPF